MLLRVFALYGGSQHVVYPLYILFALSYAVSFTFAGLTEHALLSMSVT